MSYLNHDELFFSKRCEVALNAAYAYRGLEVAVEVTGREQHARAARAGTSRARASC